MFVDGLIWGFDASSSCNRLQKLSHHLSLLIGIVVNYGPDSEWKGPKTIFLFSSMSSICNPSSWARCWLSRLFSQSKANIYTRALTIECHTWCQHFIIIVLCWLSSMLCWLVLYQTWRICSTGFCNDLPKVISWFQNYYTITLLFARDWCVAIRF